MYLKCSMCSQAFNRVVQFTDLSAFYHHVYIHRLESNFRIRCGVENCTKYFKNIYSLRSHMSRNHKLDDNNSSLIFTSIQSDGNCAATTRFIKCTLCDHKYNDLTEYRIHFYTHFNDQITHNCFYKSCCYSTKSLGNFKSHHTKKHREATIDNLIENLFVYQEEDHDCDNNMSIGEPGLQTYELPQHDCMRIDQIQEPNSSDNIKCVENSAEIDLRTFYVRFYTKLKDVKLIPKSTCDEIFEDINEMIRIKDQFLIQNIQDNLKTYGVSESIQAAITSQIRFSNKFSEIHKILKGEKKKKNFIEQSDFFVPPKEILLGTDEVRKYTFHYVPIKKSLKALLSRRDIIDKLFLVKPTDNGTIKSFKDGSVFRNNNLLKHDDSILLEFYSDEFEIVNPIGDARGMYKATGIYYRLGNLHWSLKSTIHSIQLAALCISRIWSSYGQSKILEVIVNDIKELELNGVDVELDGKKRNFKATVSVFIGDNKGSNAIGGFVESFSSKVENFCRFCQSSPQARQDNFRENQFQLRTLEAYVESARVAKSTTNGIHNGVKFNSILNELNYFNVIDGLPVDHMHDFYEGVVQQTFSHMMKALNSAKLLNINQLNESLKAFKYGKHDKENKVPHELFHQRNINKTNSFKMSASKCWTLLRIFPLIYGETLKDNIYYQNFIKLNVLNRFILQDEFDDKTIKDIEDNVFKYLSEFKRIYPGTNISPKQHFLTHYGGNIRKFGPLRHISTMRFESKHSFFKKVTKSINNNRNVTYSMSQRHQLNQYFHLTSAFFFNSSTFGKCKAPNNSLIKDIKKILPNQAEFDSALCFSWVDYKGTKYYVNDIICIKVNNNKPQFGKIEKIIEINGKIFFYIIYTINKFYVEHMCAYLVTTTSSKSFLNIEDIHHFMPLDLYNLQNKLYVAPKYNFL
jgi:hypothetical protein